MNLDVIEVLAILAAGFTTGSIFTLGIYKIANPKEKEEKPINTLYKILREEMKDNSKDILKSIEKSSKDTQEILECIEEIQMDVDDIQERINEIDIPKKDRIVKYTNAIKESFGQFTKEFLQRIENTVNDGKDEGDE